MGIGTHGGVTFISKQWAEIIDVPVNMISITCPDDEIAKFPVSHKNLYRLDFDDITPDMNLDNRYVLFNEYDAKQIIEFVKSLNGESVIVHCQAGISRSAAIAKFLHDHMGYDNLYLGKPCIGTLEHYNKYVYETLEIAGGVNTLAAFYRHLENLDKSNQFFEIL